MSDNPPAGWYPDPNDPEAPKPLHGLAWWAYSVLAFSVLANAFYTAAALIYAGKVQKQIDIHSLTVQQAEDAENLFAVGSVIWLIGLVAGAIGFLVWWYRAYDNLPGLTGFSRRFGRGWAVGAWFVPILSLWRPKQIGNDIWRAGDPAARGNREWMSLQVGSLVLMAPA